MKTGVASNYFDATPFCVKFTVWDDVSIVPIFYAN